MLERYKILGRRFILSFTIFSHSEYYIMRFSLYNTSQHRNGDTRLKGEEAADGSTDGGFFQAVNGVRRKDFYWLGNL